LVNRYKQSYDLLKSDLAKKIAASQKRKELIQRERLEATRLDEEITLLQTKQQQMQRQLKGAEKNNRNPTNAAQSTGIHLSVDCVRIKHTSQDNTPVRMKHGPVEDVVDGFRITSYVTRLELDKSHGGGERKRTDSPCSNSTSSTRRPGFGITSYATRLELDNSHGGFKRKHTDSPGSNLELDKSHGGGERKRTDSPCSNSTSSTKRPRSTVL